MYTSSPGDVRTAVETGRWEQVEMMVATASRAAEEFRRPGQKAVVRIVLAMGQARLRAAGNLAELAIEETGFGVFEDKVIKNYVATEFLWDYLKDKRSVGVIDEDSAAGISHVAE